MSVRKNSCFRWFFRIQVPYIALSLFKYNAVINGHEFNPSTEKKVTTGSLLWRRGHVCMSTSVHYIDLYLSLFGLFLLGFFLEMGDLFKKTSEHSFNINRSVLLLLCQSLERFKKKMELWNQFCWNFGSTGSHIDWHYKCAGEEGGLD